MERKWEIWASCYEPKVRKFVAGRVFGYGRGNRVDVDDIVSNTMLKFIEINKEVNEEYVRRIAQTETAKHFAAVRGIYRGKYDTGSINIDADILTPFISSLSPEEKVVWLALTRQLKQKDAAEMISRIRKAEGKRKRQKITDSAVRMLVAKMAKKLADYLHVPAETVRMAIKNARNNWHQPNSCTQHKP